MKRKKKIPVIIISVIFGLLLIASLFLGSGAAPLIWKSVILLMGMLYFALLFYSIKRLAIMETERGSLFMELKNLSVVSNQLFAAFFDFYDRFLTSLNINNKEYNKPQFDAMKEESFLVRDDYSITELLEITDSVIVKSGRLINIIKDENDHIIQCFQNEEPAEDKKRDFKNIILEMKYYSDIIYEFMASIIKNFYDSTEPLSSGIYNIKLKTSDFLENVTKWNNELTDEKSDKNFNKIIMKYNKQNDEFENIFHNLDENYDFLDQNLGNIIIKFKVLLENADAINEISENIRVLSINASLESIKAGNFGKGFKIVADEVKKLSGTTQSYVKKIIPLIHETSGIITQTLQSFEKGRKVIVDKINEQKKEFNVFYEILTNYYNDFNKIFTFISKVIEDVNLNINNLVPIFHLSNLSLQEMENLNRMIQLFLNKHHSEISQNIQDMPFEEKKIVLDSLILAFNKETTTEKELDVINKIFVKQGFEKIDLKKTKKKVELF